MLKIHQIPHLNALPSPKLSAYVDSIALCGQCGYHRGTDGAGDEANMVGDEVVEEDALQYDERQAKVLSTRKDGGIGSAELLRTMLEAGMQGTAKEGLEAPENACSRRCHRVRMMCL